MKHCRFFTIMLTAVLTSLTLAACGESQPPQESILLADLLNYVLIRSEFASEELILAAAELRDVIAEAAGLESLPYQDDESALETGELEILIGDTNREESQQFIAGLRYKEYGFTVINNKIVIAGSSDEYTIKAIELFTEKVLGSNFVDEAVFMYHETTRVTVDYSTDDMTIASIPVKGLQIVYPAKGSFHEQAYSEIIAEMLSETSGYTVKVYSSDKADYTDSDGILIVGSLDDNRGITIPADLASDESYISAKGNTILVGGTSVLSISNAVTELQSRIEESGGKAVSLSSEERFTIDADLIKAMSFNILFGNRTEERIARVTKMIINHMPDVFGVQEALPEWMTILESNLTEYESVGVGRDGGESGEYNAVFYLRDKYTLIDSGTKWLSDTPDEVSKNAASSCNRIMTYAVLKRNSDGKVFVHINTHLDFSNAIAREWQADVLVSLAEQFKEYPIIMTGDFNCKPQSGAYAKIISAGYESSSEIAQTAVTGGTYHAYADYDHIIDFCFVTPDKINVLKYKVCNKKIDGDYASDHHPVYVECLLN